MHIYALVLFGFLFSTQTALAQPEITSWLQNTTQTGSYYTSGNSTPIDNGILVNCQSVEYSNDYVYIQMTGIPSYPTGPFLDGNPSQAQDENRAIRLYRHPQEGPGTIATTGGNIGVFINGVALFDYRDGVAWNPTTNSLCGGPGNPPCPGGPGAQMDWNRDAVLAEMQGFDCSKGHPAMGNYHHHQNPSAFDLDINVVSTVCNLYDADGLYAIDASQHSPLIGYAYDGFPIYGAYGYQNTDGTGGIVRIKSGYELGSHTTRTHYPDGTDVDDGPDVSGAYPLGYFREDYQWVAHPGQEDYLDVHNGRFCVTPEYPQGTYCYFATVDENWNSAYPYAVGPNFRGEIVVTPFTTINETTTVYEPVASLNETEFNEMNINVFPNPASGLIAIQVLDLLTDDLNVELVDVSGKIVKDTKIHKGSTIAYFDVQTVYSGIYYVRISNKDFSRTTKVVIE